MSIPSVLLTESTNLTCECGFKDSITSEHTTQNRRSRRRRSDFTTLANYRKNQANCSKCLSNNLG